MLMQYLVDIPIAIVTAVAANGLPIYIANSSGKGYIDAKMTVQTDGKVSFAPPSCSRL